MSLRLSSHDLRGLSEERMEGVAVGMDPALELAFIAEAGRSHLPVILVHGLGQTVVDWPTAFIAALSARGLRPIRLDNRDVGRSSRFDERGEPSLLLQALSGAIGLAEFVPPPYCLSDMAADVLSLMDCLRLGQAHLVGVSMGGMIVQRVAARAPHRVSSLTCIMSSSGAPGLSRARADVDAALASSRTVGASDMLAFRRLVAGHLTVGDDAELAARVSASFAYGSPHGAGALRQYAAIMADTERYKLLPQLRAPTLVIHGEDDPFVRPDHGIDIAARIPGATLQMIPLLGHEITASFAPVLAQMIERHILLNAAD